MPLLVVALPADAVAVVGRTVYVVAAILDQDGPLLRIVLDRLSAFGGHDYRSRRRSRWWSRGT